MPAICRTPFTQHSEFTRKLFPEVSRNLRFWCHLGLTTFQYRFRFTHLTVSHNSSRGCLGPTSDPDGPATISSQACAYYMQNVPFYICVPTAHSDLSLKKKMVVTKHSRLIFNYRDYFKCIFFRMIKDGSSYSSHYNRNQWYIRDFCPPLSNQ